jgi:signal transduction histidine kinase
LRAIKSPSSIGKNLESLGRVGSYYALPAQAPNREVAMPRFISSIAFLFLLVSPALAATPKNVLTLHEGNRLLPYQILMAHQLEAELGANKDFTIEMFEEYLDSWRLDQNMSRSAAALQAKYANKKFDVVIADGAAALQLLLESPPQFLRGTPVVFLSEPDYRVPPHLPANVTGVVTHIDYAGTVRLAQALQPELEHIYYIDSGPHQDGAKLRRVQQELQPVSGQLDIVYWQNQDLNTLLTKVSALPAHSAILFDTYFMDPQGHTYIPAQVGSQITARANAPTYTLYQTGIGVGPVGGVVVNFDAIGRLGARMALAILHGVNVSHLPIKQSPNQTAIDWRQFERFQLPQSQLSPTVAVFYRQPGLWAKYHWYFLAGGVVILFQAILIGKLGLEAKRRRASERSTGELASRLMHAQEEERRRIAGELHDDVSQRLALVCLQLDTMRGSPPESREALVQELSVLYDETDLISSDIHQFSHDLHPAILERLGLLPALRSFCSEFSCHRKIAVNMKVSGEEPALEQDTALALFRTAQECLTNIAKHSGALACDVTLTFTRSGVLLEIADEGAGFEPLELKDATGLGIESMRERLRSVGGSLNIESALLKGTRIRAQVHIKPPTQQSTPTFLGRAPAAHHNISAL